MTYILLLPFALAPSLIWLAFFLRKDTHPEPNRMILKVFLLGMLVTIPAIYIETFLEGFLSSFSLPRIGYLFLYFLAGIALVEELLKYLVVRFGVFSNSALDEPVDVMLYMIIAGLGFAAFENILLLFRLIQTYPVTDIFLVNTVRFVQAVFLHALVSGLFGYFLAFSLVRSRTSNMKKSGFKQQGFLFFFGFFSATILHGLFNFYIFYIGGQSFFLLLLPVIPLAAIAVFISFGFRQLKNL